MEKIFIFATCQGVEIANLLRPSASVSRHFEIDSRFNFLSPGVPRDPREDLDVIRASRFFFYQKNALLDQAFLASLPDTVRSSQIPYVTSKIYWPTMLDQYAEPRFLRCEQNPYGYIPFRCWLLEKMIDAGWSDERVIERYSGAKLDKVMDLEGHFAGQIEHLRRLDQENDIKVADFINDNVRGSLLFHLFNHPALPVIRHIAGGMIGLLGLKEDLPADMTDRFAHSQLPIHPSVIQAYGLRFARDGRVWNLGPHKVDFQGYLRLYIAEYRRIVLGQAC